MIILPAIDIYQGNCVRLYKGDFSTVQQVAKSYQHTAEQFLAQAAEWIHMVDLDGAKEGSPQNASIFKDVAQNSGLKVELGGGIRSMKTIENYLLAGVTRIILGSVALNQPTLVREAVNEYGSAIAVGIDAKQEMVAAQGWLDTSSVHYLELAKKMEQQGVTCLIYTDISKDGTLSGPNLEQLDAINRAVSCNIIASGGIKDLQNIRELKAMGLYGTICGKSLYQGTLDLKEAIAVAGEEG